jgi:hypothetical protein
MLNELVKKMLNVFVTVNAFVRNVEPVHLEC